MRTLPTPLAFLLAAVLAGTAQAGAPSPTIGSQLRVLPNGLKVYAVRDSSRRKVSVQVWYRVGSRDDPPGRRGLAHLLEHLTFLSRGDAPPGYLDELTEGLGGDSNASTAIGFTEYHDTAPPQALERLLWAEASRMAAFSITRADLDAERRVVERELKEGGAADPDGRTVVARTSGGAVGLTLERDPVGGRVSDLRRIRLEDVRQFHARYYRPDNAALVVAGDFDPAQLDRWVDTYFGRIPKPAAQAARPAAARRRPLGPVASARGPEVATVLVFRAPSARSRDAAPLRVIDALLTRGDDALGPTALTAPGRASDVVSELDLRRSSGLFYFGATYERGASRDAVERGLQALLADLRRSPVSAQALQSAKNQLLLDILQDRETLQGLGEAIGRAATVEGDAGGLGAEPAAIASVSAADVRRVARRYLRDGDAVRIRLHDGERSPGAAARARPSSPPVIVEAAAPRLPALPEPPAAATSLQPTTPPVLHEARLANGLRTVVARTDRAPLATAMLVAPMPRGSPPDRDEDVALLAADQALFGCGRSARTMTGAYDGLGLSATASVEEGSAKLTVTGLSATLPRGLELLARCLRAQPPSPARYARMRRDLLQRQPMLAGDVDLVGERALRSLELGEPRHQVRRGRPKAASLAIVTAYRRALFQPGRAVLILTGDVDPAAAAASTQRLFGTWAPGAAAPPGPPRAAAARSSLLVADAPGFSLAAVTVGAAAPERPNPARPAFSVATSILAGSYTSRLSTTLRVRRPLTYDVSGAMGWRPGGGLFRVRTAVEPAMAPTAAALISEEIVELARTGPSPRELAKHKALVTAEIEDEGETTEGLADLLARQAASGEPIADLFQAPQRIAAVSGADVQAAAAQIADPSALRTVIVADLRRLPQDFVRRLGPGERARASSFLENAP